MVPVSAELYGSSRSTGCGGRGAGVLGGAGRSVAVCVGAAGVRVAGVVGVPGAGFAGVPAAGAGFLVAGVRPLFRRLSIACLILSQPSVVPANSAHTTSMLRRMISLQGEKDTGAIGTAEHLRIAPLGMRHDTDYVAAGARNAGDAPGRAVGVVSDIAPYDAPLGLELVRGALVRHIAAVAGRDGGDELLVGDVGSSPRRIGGFHAHPHGARQKPQPSVAHQRARQQAGLAQDLEPVAD